MGRAESVAAELQTLGALGTPQFGKNGKVPTPTPSTPLPDEDRQLLRELSSHAQQQIQLVRSSIASLVNHVERLEVMVQGMEEIAALGEEPTEEVAPQEVEAETESGEDPDAPAEAEDLEEEPQEEQPDGNLQEAS